MIDKSITKERLAKHTDATIVPCENRTEWLDARRSSVGASESPVLFPESGVRYASRVSLWADKVHPPLVTGPSTTRQKIGLGLEPFLCNLYREQFGGQVEQWPEHTIARSKERDYMHATPDAVVFEADKPGPGCLQIKTWSEFDRGSWQAEPPLPVQIQVQHELAVLGWQWGVIGVLFGNQRLDRFYVERNDQFIDVLLMLVEEFWAYVADQIEPPMDESIATAKALERLHPDDSGEAIALPPDMDAVVESLERAKRVRSICDRRVKRCENELKACIGDATYGMTQSGNVFSWKTQERKAHEVSASKFRQLRAIKRLPKGIELESGPDYKIERRKKLPAKLKDRLLSANPHCYWCGAKLTKRTATFEHYIPLAVGGTNDYDNITLACRPCNEARGSDATKLKRKVK